MTDHIHHFLIAALPVDGRYAAACACGATRVYPAYFEDARYVGWNKQHKGGRPKKVRR